MTLFYPPDEPEEPLSDLDAPGAKAHANAGDTERAAQWAKMPTSGTQRRKVLQLIWQRPRTDEEISVVGRISPSSVRPRRVELIEGGWVEDSGLRRDSTYGHAMTVWAVTEAGSRAYADEMRRNGDA